MLDLITPVILTRDEEPNIARTLGQLEWAAEVIVLDSMSSDQTVEIARSFPNATVVQRPFTTLAEQWTAAIAMAATPWVLTLDADYFLPRAFVEELSQLRDEPAVAGWSARFRYSVNGRVLRATLYTPRTVLLRREATTFYMDGHTQRVRVDGGEVRMLAEAIVHDDRKSFARFIQRQRRYMRDEAAKIRATPFGRLSAAGRLRKLIVLAPAAVLLHTLFLKRLVLDGSAGFRYALERFVAECILSWELLRLAVSHSTAQYESREERTGR